MTCTLTLAGVVAVAPAPATAFVPGGALSQLPEPFECIGESKEAPKALCGSSVPGGLNTIFQAQVSPDGKSVYSVAVKGDVIEYSRNPANGALTVIGCIAATASGPKCAPENETRGLVALTNPTSLALSPNGEDVYVAATHTVTTLARDPGTGLLSVPKGVKGNTACVESGTGGECEVQEAKGLGSPYGVVVSADEKSVYVTSVGGEALAELERSAETGQLAPIVGHECIGGPKSECPDAAIGMFEPIGVVASPDGESVYVAAGASESKGDVAAFERSAATGVLKQLGGEKGCVSEKVAGCTVVKALQGSEDLAITPDGKFLYAASQADDALVALKREAGGALKQLTGEAGCLSNQAISGCKQYATGETRIGASRGVALSPEAAEDLYVGSSSESAVSSFARNKVTGALAPLEKPFECLTSNLEGCGGEGVIASGLIGLEETRRLTVSPDGTNVYAAGQGGNDLEELAREVKPKLTDVQPKEGSEAGGEEVTITGKGFREGDQVLFGTEPALGVTVNSSESITAISPSVSAGPSQNVTVINAAGEGSEPVEGKYKFNVASTPTVTGLSARFGPQGGGTPVKITGSQFLAGATVHFGGAPATGTVVNSGTSITAISPAGSGVEDVTVTTAKGTSATGEADHFKYNFVPPKKLGGLDTTGYCESLGDHGTAGSPAKLLRGAVEGTNFAFENWACETNAGALVPIASSGPAPSEDDMCHFEYPGVPSFAFAEEPNSAFSWACYETPPGPPPPTGPGAKTAGNPPPVPAPVLATTGNVAPVSGIVLVRLPGSKRFVALTTLTSIPFGTLIDATKGRVIVTTAAPHGGTQTGEFFAGLFILTQGRNGLVVATLAGGDFSVCPTARERAHRAALRGRLARSSRKHIVRKLWTNAHGSFSSRGNYAAGVVAGTEWLTEDLCDGTLIRVTRDKVRVTNLVNHRVKLVRVGHSYTAAAPGG